jgi:sRNA-binding regulator protein Hfq
MERRRAADRLCGRPGRGDSRGKKEEVNIPQQSAKSARAPEQTFEEAKYLKQLIENATPVRVKLEDGEEVAGTIEYYDQSFIRLTRKGEPNLFIFKHDIKYIQEVG